MEKTVVLVYTRSIRPCVAILYWRLHIMCVLIVAKYCLCLSMPNLSLVFWFLYKWG